MKLITFLMTDKSVKEHLTGDRLLIELCDLWDEFQVIEKEEFEESDALQTLMNMDKFTATSAKVSVGSKINKYLKEITGDKSYYYSNALTNFCRFFDHINEPSEHLLSEVSRTPPSYY